MSGKLGSHVWVYISLLIVALFAVAGWLGVVSIRRLRRFVRAFWPH